MRFVTFGQDGQRGLAVADAEGRLRGFMESESAYPGNLDTLVQQGAAVLARAGRQLATGRRFDEQAIAYLPLLSAPPKIICVGLNYADHAAEGGFKPPEYPTIFGRFASSLIGHGAPLLRPRLSEQFDYEGELVAVIGRGGRYIAKDAALEHVIGYSIFNDGSVRDYQFKTPQWTVGKNFDGTGAFGPCLVTPDELPPGAQGLRLQTRLNGRVMQDASTQDLIFDVASLIALLSEAFTLEPGDVIVTGTPSGIGFARKPPVFMQHGDICEVEVEGIGTLVNPVRDERA